MARSPNRVNPEDQLLFERAMADVRQIEGDQRTPEPSHPEPAPLADADQEVLEHLERLVTGRAPFALHDSDEFIQGAVPGLDARILKRLRRGEFAPQADLDLHGARARDAQTLVLEFLQGAHARGLRCLRIVHGRGRNSPGGVAVLKESLPRWLSRGPARHLVLAYSSAPSNDGGTGVTYVLLRRRGRPQRGDSL